MRLLTDFATVADARSRALFDGLDDVALARARARQDGGELMVEGADAQSDRDGFDALLESTLVLTAALVVFLKDSFDASFTVLQRLLRRASRRHAVGGGALALSR